MRPLKSHLKTRRAGGASQEQLEGFAEGFARCCPAVLGDKKFAEGYSADTMMYWGKAPPAPEPESKVLEVPKAPSMTPTAEPTSRDAAGDKTSLPCTCRNGLFGLLLKDWLMLFGLLIMTIAAFLFHRVRKVPTT